MVRLEKAFAGGAGLGTAGNVLIRIVSMDFGERSQRLCRMVELELEVVCYE